MNIIYTQQTVAFEYLQCASNNLICSLRMLTRFAYIYEDADSVADLNDKDCDERWDVQIADDMVLEGRWNLTRALDSYVSSGQVDAAKLTNLANNIEEAFTPCLNKNSFRFCHYEAMASTIDEQIERMRKLAK